MSTLATISSIRSGMGSGDMLAIPGKRAGSAGDHRRLAGHGLGGGEAEALVTGGNDGEG